MIKKVISLAMAICMLAALFVGMNASAAAPALTGSLVTTDSAGNSKDTYFIWEDVYFFLTFQVDGLGVNSEFDVKVVDNGGNVMAQKVNVHTNVPGDGTHESWSGGGAGWFWLPPWTYGAGVYWLKATLHDTGQLMFSDSFTILQPGVVIQPDDRVVFAPGENITIEVTVQHPDGDDGMINVTLGGVDGGLNITWVNQELSGFKWSKAMTIPADTLSDVYAIWVNRSSDGANLLNGVLNVQYFGFNIMSDRWIYLPGEELVGSWLAWSIPTFAPLSVTVDFNLTYTDGILQTPEWQNNSLTSSPFTIDLPVNADIDDDINVEITARSAHGNITDFDVILLGNISGKVTTDKQTYRSDEGVITTVTSRVFQGLNWDLLPNAAVTVKMDDGAGKFIPGVNVSGLTTGLTGTVRTVVDLPAGIEPGMYRVIITVEKVGMKTTASTWIQVLDNWNLRVMVDKQMYIGGESILVDVTLVINGETVAPDRIYYDMWLMNAAILEITGMTAFTNFTLSAPSNVDDLAAIWIDAVVGTDTYGGMSPIFAIAPQTLSLSASQIDYMAGDDVDFEVLMLGSTVGFTVKYLILDNLAQSVANGTLTLNSNGVATFRLEVPDENVPAWYTVSVVADNGNGRVLDQSLIIGLADVYLVKYWIITDPAYQTGEYAPGQTITIGFELIPQIEMPVKPMVKAKIVDTTIGWDGEVKTFSAMKGELQITLPVNAMNGQHTLTLTVYDLHFIGDVSTYDQMIVVGSNGVFNSNIAGMSLAEMFILLLVVITLLLVIYMMMKGGAGAATAGAAAPEAPAPKKEETYQPKSSVKCPACGSMIEVATSKRPIEVMCPKCGTSQIVN